MAVAAKVEYNVEQNKAEGERTFQHFSLLPQPTSKMPNMGSFALFFSGAVYIGLSPEIQCLLSLLHRSLIMILVKVAFLLAFIVVASLHQLPNPECDVSVSSEETSDLKYKFNNKIIPNGILPSSETTSCPDGKRQVARHYREKDHTTLNKMSPPNFSPQSSGVPLKREGKRSGGDRETKDTSRTKPSKSTGAKLT